MTPSDPTPEPSRVAALERHVRRLSAIAVFLSLGFLLVIVLHFYPLPTLLEGRALRINDGRGMRRIELGFRDDGSPMLRLNDAGQHARAMLFVAEDGRTTFRLSEAQGTHRAQLLLEPDGRPVLMLAGRDGRSRVTLSVTPEGVGDLELRDASGAQAARSR